MLPDGNSKNVTQVLFTIHSATANLFSKGQFWGRAALAPVDLSQDPGAFLLLQIECLQGPAPFVRGLSLCGTNRFESATKAVRGASCILVQECAEHGDRAVLSLLVS
jgi:hypothetical protein